MFTIIEDGIAILRAPKGVYRQSKVYHWRGRVYVAYGSGFLRITAKFGDSWGTSHPDVKVVEIDADGVSVDGGEAKFVG